MSLSIQSTSPLLTTESPILRKKAQSDDKRITVLVLTDNEFKRTEYNQFLGEGYGVNLFYRKPPEVITNEVIRNILSEWAPSPHYILREESRLINDLNKEELSGTDIVKNPEKSPRFISNQAELRVWKPRWNKDNATLSELEYTLYVHQVKGYIDANRTDQRNETVFGWDHLFVNAQTGRTHLDTVHSLWGKNSARQLVLADFVTRYLFYPYPKTLVYHTELKPKQAVEFSMNMSVGRFMESNKYLSNRNLSVWGLEAIRTRILAEGVFFSAATSRPVGNYFSPPFGGIPLTPKKTDVEETVFMMHDLNHHNIPDLIFDGDDSEQMRNVYVAWRMMSEAMTLVIADMLYADTLVRSDSENAKKVDSRIYPLFQALAIENPTDENRQSIVRSLLWANTQYALFGDDSAWRRLLKPDQEDKLNAYKRHFEKFFVGDHVWTNTNFKNMSSMKDFYTGWITTVGKDQFAKAGLLLLSDITARIEKRGADLLSLKDVVKHVFEEILESRIFPTQSNPDKIDDKERLSRGFHRYMIGQMSFYFRYQDLVGMPERTKALAGKLQATSTFDEMARNKIYSQYMNDVRYVWGLGVITSASAENYIQKHPIFPPVYINYSRQESKSVMEAVDKLYGAPSWTKTDSVFVNTSNEGKLAEYREYFKPQVLISKSQDLKEPDADPMTVIQYKASQFDRVLVDDVALDVEGMDIGINIRSFISKNDLAKFAGKKSSYVCRIAIKVGEVVRVYESAVQGILVEPRGSCFGFGMYFLPKGTDKTLGEYMNPQFNARYLAIQKFKKDERSATLPILKEWNGAFQK